MCRVVVGADLRACVRACERICVWSLFICFFLCFFVFFFLKKKSTKEIDYVYQGELGENVLVEGVPYDFFKVGRRYMIGGSLV